MNIYIYKFVGDIASLIHVSCSGFCLLYPSTSCPAFIVLYHFYNNILHCAALTLLYSCLSNLPYLGNRYFYHTYNLMSERRPADLKLLAYKSQCFVTIRKANFWTCSNSILSFCRYGDQIAEAYSRWGRTNDLYSCNRVAGEVKL